MCGIVGFVDFGISSSKEILSTMCGTLSHRGPDFEGLFWDQPENCQVGLGHRRLSIIDLTDSANQPMVYKNRVIVFNGEIYNYAEIREELKGLGRKFSTKSDTEVILQSFDEWGQEAVKKFIGMFAFLLYDLENQELYTVRDRAGVKPLHVYSEGNILMWASELKAFHRHPLFKKELNLESVKAFLQLGYVPSPASIFVNVTKQQPGTICKYKLREGTHEVFRYWDVNSFYQQRDLKTSYEEAKEEVRRLLISACHYRMIADVPVGIFLSGGFDSTLVASLLQSENGKRIKTFTIGVKDSPINEAEYAKQIAKHLDTEHTELYLSEKEMFDQLENFSYFYDEPFGDSSAIPTMAVSQMASREVKVVLSADGGDEVDAGYNRYDKIGQLNRIKKIRKIPFIRTAIKAMVRNPYDQSRLLQLIENPDVITLAMTLDNPYYQGEADQFFIRNVGDTSANIDAGLEKIADALPKILSYDYQNYFRNDILVKVDRATMRYSIEGREPLIDHRLLEFLAPLPDHFKIREGVKKFMFRDIVYDYIPKELMDRPKMGFAAPVDTWLHSALKERIDYYFSKSFIERQGIFSFEAMDTLKKRYYAGKEKYTIKIWYFFIFQMWWERWMG